MRPVPHTLTQDHRRAFTLVEVIVAAILLAVLTVGTLSTMVMASELTHRNGQAIAAKNIAQGFLEQMAADDFGNINATHYPNRTVDDATPVWLDQASGIRCAVQFTFSGFGVLKNSGNSSKQLTATGVNWAANHWQGCNVYILDGDVKGQYAPIQSSTTDRLNLAAPLSGTPNGARYMINNGKTVTIDITWVYRGLAHQQRVESLIINAKNSSSLGF